MDDVQFGNQLRAIRREMGLTQEQLAERMDLVQDKKISDWECGRTDPRVTTVRRLAQALEVPSWRLLEERE